MNDIKLFLDEDIHANLGPGLRKRGFDVEHAQESGRKGKSDLEQLLYAIENNRCFVTFNVKDFVQIHNEFAEKNQEHYGIIVSKQIPIGQLMRSLLHLLSTHSPHSLKNQILFL